MRNNGNRIQVAIFNKGIVDSNHLHWTYFVKNTSSKYILDDIHLLKRFNLKYVLMNDNELLNIQACSFLIFWIWGCTQTLVASCNYWVVPLISIRVSGMGLGLDKMLDNWAANGTITSQNWPHSKNTTVIKFIHNSICISLWKDNIWKSYQLYLGC